MPLVTLTCSKKYYPADDETTEVTTDEQITIELAKALPHMMISKTDALGIGDVPPDVVQVDIRKFHARSVNSVDLWVHIWFTETWDSPDDRNRVRDTLLGLLTDWMLAHSVKVSFALDVFFGPSVGTLVDEKGQVIETW